jgi:hypothetical protein
LEGLTVFGDRTPCVQSQYLAKKIAFDKGNCALAAGDGYPRYNFDRVLFGPCRIVDGFKNAQVYATRHAPERQNQVSREH